ncbi:DUF2147 domain-containing protein [Pedobacter africanus]|uniref:DUF2147 domain-containing protein n=1 Tax=Pedobacter africanus TaxID=151894 RepID=A0A1W1ZDI3_9SPHI|nr:DUF2147 domain-containing protein [Pedobacter africanus]SMC46515.1 hypothetical protein SAMN04488524_0629 [Pedobacter africanus]
MKKLSFILLLTAISFAGLAQNKDAIIGKWINSSGEAHVDITKKGEKYYGKIVWLKEPKDEKGTVKTDVKNPEKSLQSRPILGLEILKDFVYEDGKWTDGKIYDPKSGKTYSCNMSMKGNDVLNMRGYIGISLIGRSETWKRVK